MRVLHCFEQQRRHVDLLHVQRTFVRVQARQQQEVVDKCGHAVGTPLDPFARLFPGQRIVGRDALEHLRVPADRRERRPQLVTGVRDEAAQTPVRGVAGLEGRLQIVEHRVDRPRHRTHLRPLARQALRESLAQHRLAVAERQGGDPAGSRRDLLEGAQGADHQESGGGGDDEDPQQHGTTGGDGGPGDEPVRVLLRQSVHQGGAVQRACRDAVDVPLPVQVQLHGDGTTVPRHGGERCQIRGHGLGGFLPTGVHGAGDHPTVDDDRGDRLAARTGTVQESAGPVLVRDGGGIGRRRVRRRPRRVAPRGDRGRQLARQVRVQLGQHGGAQPQDRRDADDDEDDRRDRGDRQRQRGAQRQPLPVRWPWEAQRTRMSVRLRGALRGVHGTSM